MGSQETGNWKSHLESDRKLTKQKHLDKKNRKWDAEERRRRISDARGYFKNIKLPNRYGKLLADSVQVDRSGGSYATFESGVQIYNPSSSKKSQEELQFPREVDLGDSIETLPRANGTCEIFTHGKIYTMDKNKLKIFVPSEIQDVETINRWPVTKAYKRRNDNVPLSRE